jgi:hypothetical protein
MVYFVTGRTFAYDWDKLSEKEISYGTYDDFSLWIEHETRFGLDTETTMTKDGPNAHDDRELLVLQLGNEEDQWVFDMVDLPEYWLPVLKTLLEDETKVFFIHNSKFDYIVLRKGLGAITENMHDTFLMSKVLNTGIETYNGYHSLAGCLKRFFDIEISKDAQTTFTGEPLTIDQIIYSAIDVIMMEQLFDKLKKELEHWKLWYLYDGVERHVVKAYCDMELNPMRFDSSYWKTLADDFDIEDAKIEKELNELVFKDPQLVEYLKESKNVLNIHLIQPKDELLVKWGSPKQKKTILSYLVPSLPEDATTKPKIKKFAKENADTLPEQEVEILDLYMNREYDTLETYLIDEHYTWLVQQEFLIKENTMQINWASSVHKLYIFQFYYPRLRDTNTNSLARIKKNELITKFKQYSAVHKTVTTYGRKFPDKYVSRNNTIAPSGLNQVLNTGRVAFGILLQMPGKARFRNGFLPPEDDWVFVDSDYASAELAIMASLSGEESLLDVVRTGKDAHMFVAQKLFPTKWDAAADAGCIQLTTGKKCKCPGHDKLRKSGKAFNFGIP